MPDTLSMFEELRIAFVEAIVSCRVESNEKAVHRVRTGSRRLEALLRKVREDHPGAAGLQHESERALKQLNKIRKIAGSVRDLDVQRTLAEEVKDEMSSRKSAATREKVAKEHERLDRYLIRRRKRGADALCEDLADRELKIERSLEGTAKEFAGLTASSPSPLATAREWTRRFEAKMQELNEGSLHDFRKRTKAARYIAELQKTSPAAKRFASELHGVQDAIGEWHDWELLVPLARKVLGKDAAIVEALKKKRDQALDASLRKTRGQARRRSGPMV